MPPSTTGLLTATGRLGVISVWGMLVTVVPPVLMGLCGAAPRRTETGGQDSDEADLWAQALLRSHRRRGEAPHQVLPGNRHIRGKTTVVNRKCGSGSPGAPGTSILACPSRVRKPGNTGPHILTIGVEDCPRRELDPAGRVPQGGLDERGLVVLVHGVSDDHLGVAVDHRRQE